MLSLRQTGSTQGYRVRINLCSGWFLELPVSLPGHQDAVS